MKTDITPAHVNQGTTWISSVLRFLRQHPIAGYFLLAFGLQWLWEIPLFGLWHQWIAGPWLLLCPMVAAFVMEWVTAGKAGMVRLLRRCVLWRVGITWYLIALLFIPALYFLGILLMPGAITDFRVPSPGFFLTYFLAFISVFFIGASLSEEPGWRGFALPRLQERFGPLVGNLLLGLLWGLWHLPLWLFLPGHSGAGAGLLGIGIPFVEWMGFIMGFTIVITWVLNHARGSVLLAMVFHASINATHDVFPGAFFPTLFPPAVDAAIPLLTELGIVLVAVVIIVATRGRLGYDQYRRDTASPPADSAVQLGPVPATPL